MLRVTIIGVMTVLLITQPATAQRVRPQFGIDGGASLATVTGNEIVGARTKVGPYFGLSAPSSGRAASLVCRPGCSTCHAGRR